DDRFAALIRQTGRDHFPGQQVDQALGLLFLDDAGLVLEVLAELFHLLLLDGLGTLILGHTLAGEDLHIDDRAFDARRAYQRGIAHLFRLLAENGPQQLLFGGELRLAFRRDLAHQIIAGLHLGADAYDAALIQVLEQTLADVRNIAGDLFRT